jgi:hypothetical protein
MDKDNGRSLGIDPGSGGWVDGQRVIDGVYHAQTIWGLLPVRQIDHPVVEDLERLLLSTADFEAARHALNHILLMPGTTAESPEEIVADVLFQGAVISYCRAFFGNPKTGLQTSDLYGTSKWLLGLHDHVWALRSKHYAHDVNGFRDAGVGLCISPNGSQFKVASQIYKMTPPPEFLRDFLKLLDHAEAYCKGLTSALSEMLHQYVDGLGPAASRDLTYLTLVHPGIDQINTDRRGKGRKPFQKA